MAHVATFKVCRCCGSKASLRKRVCNRCGVPAIWDKATPEQQAEHDAEKARKVALFEELLRETDEPECVA